MFKFQARKKAIAQRIREERFKKLIKQYMETAEVQQMDEYIQHGTTTTLTHCHNVAWLCFLVNEYLHLKAKEKELVEAAFYMIFICMTGTMAILSERHMDLTIHISPARMLQKYLEYQIKVKLQSKVICGHLTLPRYRGRGRQ